MDSNASVIAKLNAKSAQQWLIQRKDSVKPWAEFINTNSFKKPISVKQWSTRSMKNIEHYQTNYMFVFAGLIIYCIVTSPLLLIAICAFFLLSYIISSRPTNIPLKVLGVEIPTAHQYGIAALVSFPFFFIAGAGSAVFWVLGVSFFLIGAHASMHISHEEGTAEDEIPFVETV